MRRMEEALGRLGFIAGPLEQIKPFLGLVYAWIAAAPRNATLAVP